MLGFFLIGLLSISALTGLIVELTDDDDSSPRSPETPGGTDDLEITGENTPDLLQGANGNDEIEGRGGDDRLLGRDGNDSLSGEDGDDSLSGEAGNDLLFGGEGNDNLYGSDGSDIEFGGDGDDLLLGGSGDDLLAGDLGADTMSGSTGADVLIGTETGIGNSTAAEFQTAVADAGGDLDALLGVLGLPGAGEDDDQGDVMNGGYGDDNLLIGSEDTATGGGGNDIFNLGDWIQADRAASITDYDGEDDQIVYSHDGVGDAPEVTVTDDGSGNAVISVNGSAVATVTGAAGSLSADDIAVVDQSVTGTPGEDLVGTDGDDTLEGGEGDDLASGLAGDDLILLGAGDDVSHSREGEDVVSAGEGDDRVFGGDNADVILGEAGDDFLRGGAGRDLIIDTEGSDTIFGDTGADVIISSGFLDETAMLNEALTQIEAGSDPVTAGQAAFDAADVDFSADTDAGDDINGGTGDDIILFGIGDSVSGGDGADTLGISDAIPGNEAALIRDFDLAEDTLVYSAAAGSTPTVTVTYSDGATDTTGDATVLVGGEPLTVVQGVGTSFTAANVEVVIRDAAATAS